MVPPSELKHNPLTFTVVDGDLRHEIFAERGKGGKVRLTCQCPDSSSDGWCKHRLDLLCGRYAAVAGLDSETRVAFERIVAGTALTAAGGDLDRAKKAFDDCLRIFDERRPARIVGQNLGKFTDLVSDLAACSSELEDALGTMRRLLERE